MRVPLINPVGDDGRRLLVLFRDEHDFEGLPGGSGLEPNVEIPRPRAASLVATDFKQGKKGEP